MVAPQANAMAAVIKGYRCIFVMADKQSVEKQTLLRAYGAEVVPCPTNVAPESPESYYSVADRLTRAVDDIRHKYGAESLKRGSTIRAQRAKKGRGA